MSDRPNQKPSRKRTETGSTQQDADGGGGAVVKNVEVVDDDFDEGDVCIPPKALKDKSKEDTDKLIQAEKTETGRVSTQH